MTEPFPLTTLFRDVVIGMRRHLRGLLLFHLYFALLTLAVIAPVTSWISGRVLATTGEPMISNQEVIAFLASPGGLLWLLAAGTLLAVVVVIEHGGMMVLAARRPERRFRESLAALGAVGRRLHDLLVLAGLMAAGHLALAAPPLLIMAAAHELFLDGAALADTMRQDPAGARQFFIVALVAGTLILLGNGWLYLRWILALPILLFERLTPRAALARSARITRNRRRWMALPLLAGGLLILLGPALLTLAFDAGGALIGLLPERMGLLVIAVVTFLLAYTLAAIVVTLGALAANSLVILTLYRQATGAATTFPRREAPRRTGWRAWGVEAVVLLFALGQTVWVLQSFEFTDSVAISAHRGSSMKAPENTLSAIEQAIEDGADYVEVDVRHTADGRVVLLHDASLLRTTGDPRRIWEVAFEEARRLDAGSWFGPAFAGERIPTLEEAIEAVRGRARLYLEIKPSPHSPGLTRDVVAILQEQDFVDSVRLGAMDPAVLWQALALEPELRTTLFLQFAIGGLDRRFDALGLRHTMVSSREVVLARRHGHEVHVWTVNDPRQMSQLIDMGVDNIITDHPDILAGILAERAELSTAELLVIKARNWLWH